MIPFKDDVGLARMPVITIAVVVANVVAYVLAAVHGGSLIGGPSEQTVVHYGAIAYEFSHWGQHCALGLAGFGQALLCSGQHGVAGRAGPQPATWETALTALFLHANVLHLAVNMIFLGVFGASVEDRVGRLGFVGFYLLGGLVALALQVLVAPGSQTPLLGASSAIAAALGAYIVLNPRAKIRTLVVAVFRFTFVELAAWLVVVAWFVFDAILGAVGLSTAFGGSAGAAYYPHWGGVAFGALVGLALLGRDRARPDWRHFPLKGPGAGQKPPRLRRRVGFKQRQQRSILRTLLSGLPRPTRLARMHERRIASEHRRDRRGDRQPGSAADPRDIALVADAPRHPILHAGARGVRHGRHANRHSRPSQDVDFRECDR